MMTETRYANVALFVPHEGCPHDCAFCNQRTIAGVTKRLTPDDVTAACERALATLPENAKAQIAFFGGSFTAVDASYRRALLQAAQPFLQTGRFEGIRASTRPDAVDEAVLCELQTYGVTALELGAQSMDDRVLAACGRGHTANDVVRAATLVKQSGIALGLQMMTGLPLDSDDGAVKTAAALAALSPATMRIYPTVVLKGTALEARWRAGNYTPPTLTQTVALGAKLLYYFEEQQHIPVIRFGLHDGEELKSQALCGAYHPALRELCEGQWYVQEALTLLERAKMPKATVLVSPKAVSKMIGQRKVNLELLSRRGYTVRVKGDERLPLWQVRVAPWQENKGRDNNV